MGCFVGDGYKVALHRAAGRRVRILAERLTRCRVGSMILRARGMGPAHSIRRVSRRPWRQETDMTMYSHGYGWWACAPAGAACRGPGFGHFAARRWGGPASTQSNYYTWSHGPTFGVRRPLRYLAFKLDLSEDQVRDVADVLNRLKTARGQSQLDWERSVADAADAFASGTFDETKVKDALARRMRSTETLNDELLTALRKIHAILHEDQRREFAYLLRSGGIAI